MKAGFKAHDTNHRGKEGSRKLFVHAGKTCNFFWQPDISWSRGGGSKLWILLINLCLTSHTETKQESKYLRKTVLFVRQPRVNWWEARWQKVAAASAGKQADTRVFLFSWLAFLCFSPHLFSCVFLLLCFSVFFMCFSPPLLSLFHILFCLVFHLFSLLCFHVFFSPMLSCVYPVLFSSLVSCVSLFYLSYYVFLSFTSPTFLCDSPLVWFPVFHLSYFPFQWFCVSSLLQCSYAFTASPMFSDVFLFHPSSYAVLFLPLLCFPAFLCFIGQGKLRTVFDFAVAQLVTILQ